MENRRQKILLGAFIALATVALGWMVGKPLLIDPIQKDRRTLAGLRKDYARLRRAEKVLLPKAVAEWKSLASRSLGRDIQQVKNRFQAPIQHLAETHKLIKPTFNPQASQRGRRSKGAVPVRLNVVATGTLPNVTAFLGAVYELPFLVRVRRVTLTPEPSRIKSIKHVKMNATIESLALPLGEENRGFIFEKDLDPFDLPDDLDALPKREPRVLAMAIADYGRMSAKQPFHAEDPKPKPVVRPPTPKTARPTRTTRNTKPARTPAKPSRGRAAPNPAAQTLVAGILNYPPSEFVQSGRREVILRDTKNKRRTYFGLGDELDLKDAKGVAHPQGTIILIHPYGVVTQLGEETRFYRVGSLVQNYEVLDEFNNMELW